MNELCGCCEDVEQATPEPIANRPSLDTLNYRVGTHATFLASMKARLSSFSVDVGEPSEPSADYIENVKALLEWLCNSNDSLAATLRVTFPDLKK